MALFDRVGPFDHTSFYTAAKTLAMMTITDLNLDQAPLVLRSAESARSTRYTWALPTFAPRVHH